VDRSTRWRHARHPDAHRAALPARNCTWYGVFRADDNSVADSDVELADDVPGPSAGATVRVHLSDADADADADDGYAYKESGSTAWIFSGVVTLICALYVLGALFWFGRRILRRIRVRSTID
jgi:hypothetical protein